MTKETWEKNSFFMQMSNIGAEIGRTIIWKGKDVSKSKAAFERGLELLDLTIADKKNRTSKLKELCRLREMLVGYFCFDVRHGYSDKDWNDYFYPFNYAAAMEMEKRFSLKSQIPNLKS